MVRVEYAGSARYIHIPILNARSHTGQSLMRVGSCCSQLNAMNALTPVLASSNQEASPYDRDDFEHYVGTRK